MKLANWTATASGRAVIIEGEDENGEPICLDDVAKIENNWRGGETWAVRKDGEKVALS